MPPRRQSLVRPFAAVVSAGVALSGLTLINGAASAAAAHTALHVDFAPRTASAPHGYVVDYGRAWSATRGYGWTKAGTATPLSLTANTANTAKRSSTIAPDRRYASLILMQARAGHGTTTAGQWQATLANGIYNVTVGVGDATAIDSVDRVTAQPGGKNQVVLVGNFKPTKAHHFATTTKKVRVSNGLLVLSPAGGRNTKLDFVVATPVSTTKPIVTPPTTGPTTPPAAPDATAPQAAIVLTGTLVSAATYTGAVIATVNASDEVGGSGLKSVTYSLDGAAKQAYTAPLAVTTAGNHQLSVTATDNAGNVNTATSSWTLQAVVASLADTTSPTVAIGLSGTPDSSDGYFGTVTAAVTAADETGGSGLATVTYSLDGGAPTAYTAALVVPGVGTHHLTVTATDHAGNAGTANATWTSQAADTTPPSVSVALAGPRSGNVYTGTVTVTVTSADNPGGSGIDAVTYSVDLGPDLAYTVPFPVTSPGSHTVVVTATDNQGNSAQASATWSIQSTDTTAPTASISLAGTATSPNNYDGPVTATVTAADEAGGSGLKSTTYTLDGGTASAYTTPVTVTAGGHHTLVVTVKDNAGNTGSATASWDQTTTSGAALVVTSPDDAIDANQSTPRLVFSAVRGFDDPAPKAFSFLNTGSVPLTVSNLAIGGTNATNWVLATGQATSITLQPGESQQVSIQFHPTDPTGCSSTDLPYAIGDVDRYATLTYSTDDPAMPTGFDVLSGINSCYVGGNNEPVLDQILPALGYTTVVDTQYIDRRYIGPLRYLQNTDEIQSPYFTAANAAQPVSLTPIAHYGSANTVPYQATGWFAQGSAMTGPTSTCSSACKTLWQFPADPSTSTYNQNQKLLPTTTTGVTTFTPTGTFGLFSGGGTDVNFSDDGLNVGHQKSGAVLPVPHYLHDLRIYPAYGPGHVVIPNTYIVAIDLSRVPSYKNNDFQDIVLLLRNAQPAVAQATVVNATNDITDLTAGGSVSPTCAVTGFDGIMANTAGTQCNPDKLSFAPAGLTLTSTPGQLASGTQQNAIYKSFDATQKSFTVTARVLGPVTSLTTDYQQIAAFFGPDQKNFLKVEAEHNGPGDPHLTMFYDVAGASSTVATVAVPDITAASTHTLDLIIQGNTNLPDPLPFGDTYGVHGYPLDVLTVSYSINGATPVQVGTTTVSPADVTTWFSRSAKAGILVANPGAGAPSLSATFSKFGISTP